MLLRIVLQRHLYMSLLIFSSPVLAGIPRVSNYLHVSESKLSFCSAQSQATGGGGVCVGRWGGAGTIGDLTNPDIQNMQLIRKKFRMSENVIPLMEMSQLLKLKSLPLDIHKRGLQLSLNLSV